MIKIIIDQEGTKRWLIDAANSIYSVTANCHYTYYDCIYHNKYGSAFDQKNGKQEYWINGKNYDTYLEYIIKVEQLKTSL